MASFNYRKKCVKQETISTQIQSLVSDSILEARPFGRSQTLSLWVKMDSLIKAAHVLKSDPVLNLDWLENFSVFLIDDLVVLTYFLRSTQTNHELIVRASFSREKQEEKIQVPTVTRIWPMGKSLEKEAESFFGIHFSEDRGHSWK